MSKGRGERTLLRVPFWLILLGLMATGAVGAWLYAGRTTPDRPPTGALGTSPTPSQSAQEQDDPGTKSDKPSKAEKPDSGPRQRRHCKPDCAGPYLSGLDEAALSLDGLGPIRIGMTKAEASDAAGVDLVLVGDDFGTCEFAGASGDPEGISFMMRFGVVSRIDIDAGETRTLSGIGIGSSAQEVFDVYPGRIERVTNVYGVRRELLYTPSEAEYQQYSMLLSLDNRDNVTSFRSGLKEPVGYAEGCA